MHIGLIGGIGPAATVFYYQQLVKAFNEQGRDLHLTIANSSVKLLTDNLAAGRADAQAQEYKRVADQLAAAGADCLVISSMGGHFCLPQFKPIAPIPLIEGPAAVRRHLVAAGIRRPGLLGTRVVMETRLYGELQELDVLTPAGDELSQVNDDYIAMSIAGSASEEQRERLLQAGRRLMAIQNADVILLGGTDLSLVYDSSAAVPFLDTAQLHVDAIVEAALDQ